VDGVVVDLDFFLTRSFKSIECCNLAFDRLPVRLISPILVT